MVEGNVVLTNVSGSSHKLEVTIFQILSHYFNERCIYG